MKLLDFFNTRDRCCSCRETGGKFREHCLVIQRYPQESQVAAAKGFAVLKSLHPDSHYCCLCITRKGRPFYQQLKGDF